MGRYQYFKDEKSEAKSDLFTHSHAESKRELGKTTWEPMYLVMLKSLGKSTCTLFCPKIYLIIATYIQTSLVYA